MPSRRSYRPFRRNYGSNKKKWASFMKAVSGGPVTVNASSSAYLALDLVNNAAETATPTPTIIKTKHFKISIDSYVSSASNLNVIGPIVAYLMFVPQGYTLATTTPIDHPEWVLTWRSIDTSVVATSSIATHHNSITMSSSLSRNLNSGDTIKIVFLANNVGTTVSWNFNALCHFSCVVRNN